MDSVVVRRDCNRGVDLPMLSTCPKTSASEHAPRDTRMWVATVAYAEDTGGKLQLS